MGGEQSGHIVLSDHSTTGDGLIAALQVLAVLIESGRPASEVLRVFAPLPQRLRNVRCTVKALENHSVSGGHRRRRGGAGGRGPGPDPSLGTEPVVRVMAEGGDQDKVAEVVDAIADSLESAV